MARTTPLDLAIANILRRKEKEFGAKRPVVTQDEEEDDERKPENVKDRIDELFGRKSGSQVPEVRRPSPLQMPSGGVGMPSQVSAARAQPENGGMTGDADLDWIIKRESGGKPTAQNPTSSAFGIGQMIKSNRVAYGNQLGFDPNTTNPQEQIAMMKAYINDRYGSVKAARQFWERNNWY